MIQRPQGSEHWRFFYRSLTSLVQPRPIAWVSSVAADGSANLAPFSFFNVVCADPPTVLFCPMVGGRSGLEKDTLKNVRETGEFVINIVSRDLVERMNLTSAEVERGIDEFDLAGLEKRPGLEVAVPKVAAARASIECRLDRIVPIGEGPGSGSIVIGTVLLLDIDDTVLRDGQVLIDALAPIGRLSASDYCTVADRFSLDRPTPEEALVGLPARTE